MALSAAIVLEVQTGGSDTNGGGFKTGASGTDWSQQAAAQYSVTDGVTAGSTTITSATANFGTDVVGNLIYVQGGTGAVVAGWYEITVRNSATSVTVDRSTGLTAGTGVTLKIGGALLTIGAAAAIYVAGNSIWIKNGTYALTSTVTFSTTGASSTPITVSGYGSTRGDGIRPIITSSTNSVHLITVSGMTCITFRWLKLTHTAATRGDGFRIITSGSSQYYFSCIVDGCLMGIEAVNGIPYRVEECSIVNCTSHGVVFINATAGSRVDRSFIWNNAGSGILLSNGGSGSTVDIANSVIAKNGARGIYSNLNGGGLFGTVSLNYCTIANNTADGIYFSSTSASDFLVGKNNLIYGNGGAGVVTQSNTACQNNYNQTLFSQNAFGLNSSGNYINILPGIGDTAISADPFTNAGSGDFSLNTTAGGGAACRAAGFPGVFPGGLTTGYLDIGAVQHADPTGGISYFPVYRNFIEEIEV